MSDAFEFHLKVLTGELITMRDNAHTSIPILITLSYAPLIVFTFGETAHSNSVSRHVWFWSVYGAVKICQSNICISGRSRPKQCATHISFKNNVGRFGRPFELIKFMGSRIQRFGFVVVVSIRHSKISTLPQLFPFLFLLAAKFI